MTGTLPTRPWRSLTDEQLDGRIEEFLRTQRLLKFEGRRNAEDVVLCHLGDLWAECIERDRKDIYRGVLARLRTPDPFD